MKSLFFLIFIGVIAAVVGNFFEFWSIPQLAKLPTISNYAKGDSSLENRGERALSTEPESRPPAGPFGPKK